MGASAEDAENVAEKKIPNGMEMEKAEEPHGDINQNKAENVSSCCQGVNGVSCCRDVSPEVREKAEDREKKGAGKFSCLMRKWDPTEVYATVTVVGAVATIVVAYSFYKRSP